MNKHEAIAKLNNFIDVVATLPEGARIISMSIDCNDEPNENYIHLFAFGELPCLDSVRPFGRYDDAVCHYTRKNGIEIFALKEKEV